MSLFGFLKFLFGSSKSKSQPKSYEQKEKEAATKRIVKIASMTMEMVEGINDRTKSQIVTDFEFHDPKTASFQELCQCVGSRLKGKPWHWIEYDFWEPICLEKRLATAGMHNFCRPWPDALNIEEERKSFTPESIAKSTTLKAFKESWQSTHPEVSGFTRKAQITEFLQSNEETFQAIADKIIHDRWNKKKHNPGKTEDGLVALLCDTILSRISDQEQLYEDRGDGSKYQFDFGDEDEPEKSDDHKLYDLSKKVKNKPWKSRVMPNIPGLYFERDYRD